MYSVEISQDYRGIYGTRAGFIWWEYRPGSTGRLGERASGNEPGRCTMIEGDGTMRWVDGSDTEEECAVAGTGERDEDTEQSAMVTAVYAGGASVAGMACTLSESA